jgi:hypothetical protein
VGLGRLFFLGDKIRPTIRRAARLAGHHALSRALPYLTALRSLRRLQSGIRRRLLVETVVREAMRAELRLAELRKQA